MSKSISRSFTFYTVTIKDSATGKTLKTIETSQEPKKEKVAIAFIKETSNTSFVIDISSKEEKREMTIEAFLANSTVVEAK